MITKFSSSTISTLSVWLAFMQLYDESVEAYSQWRDELNSLCEQAEMSLQVMEIMNGLCSLS